MIIHVYVNITRSICTKENVPPIQVNTSNLQYCLDDLIADFRHSYASCTLEQSPGSTWNVQFTCNNYFEISKYDQKLFDGKQVFRTIKIWNYLTWDVSLAGHVINSSAFKASLPIRITAFQDFQNIIQIIESCRICEGVKNLEFAVVPKTISNLCGHNICKMEEVVKLGETGKEEHFHNRRLTCCEYLMNTCSSASRCEGCNVLRRNLSVQLVRYNKSLLDPQRKMDSKSKVNKRFLSEEEREEKENDQKRRRRNVDRRAKYWKFKASEEKKNETFCPR